MRGRFSAERAGDDDEWCERHLLARIHRYTLGRLRREIEPVEPRDFMRFLFDWQRVAPATRVSGPEALAGVLAQLEGFEAPAAAWETRTAARARQRLFDRLARRPVHRRPHRCGRACAAQRADAGAARSAPVRATPIVLLPRRQLRAVDAAGAAPQRRRAALSSRARARRRLPRANTARRSSTNSSPARTCCAPNWRTRWPSWSRAAACTATASPACARCSCRQSKRPPARRAAPPARCAVRHRGRRPLGADRGAQPAADEPSKREPGRRSSTSRARCCAATAWCAGACSSAKPPWLPPWRELLRVYHRLEARGEIRGGRFIAGLSGEQFALPEAIGAAAPGAPARARRRTGLRCRRWIRSTCVGTVLRRRPRCRA